jgi:hypothetical protein
MKKMMKILLIIEASLASAEVSAGAVAKADQKRNNAVNSGHLVPYSARKPLRPKSSM